MATTKKAAPKKRASKKAAPKKRASVKRVNLNNRKFENLLDEHGSHCTFTFRSSPKQKGRICVQDGYVYICNDVNGARDLRIHNMGFACTLLIWKGTKSEIENSGITDFRLGEKDNSIPRIMWAKDYRVDVTQ